MDFITLYSEINIGEYANYNLLSHDLNANYSGFECAILQSTYQIQMGEYKQALDILIEALKQIDKTTKNTHKLAILTKLYGLSFTGIKTIEDLVVKIEKLIDLVDRDDSFTRMIISDYYNYRGILLLEEGRIRASENRFRHAIQLEKRIGIPPRLAKVLTNYAIMKYYAGDFTGSLNLHYQVKNIRENENLLHGAAQTYGNIAEVFEKMGNYELAKQYNLMAGNIFDEINNSEEIAMNSFNLARLLSKLREINKATKQFEEAYNLRMEMKPQNRPSSYAVNLIDYLEFMQLQADNIKSSVIDELEELATQHESVDFVQLRYQFATGIKWYGSNKLLDKLKGFNQFNNIVGNKKTDSILLNRSYLFIFDILLLEYRESRNSQIINQIESYLEKFETAMKYGPTPSMTTISNLIRFQLHLYQGEFASALQYLSTSIIESFNHGIAFMENPLNHALQGVQENKNSFQDFPSEGDSYSEIDIIQSIHDLEQAIDNSEYLNSEILAIYLINNTYQHNQLFGKKLEIDNLINEDNFDAESTIQVLIEEEFIVLLLKHKYPYVIGVFTGNVIQMLIKLETITNMIRINLVKNTSDLNNLDLKSIQRQITDFIDTTEPESDDEVEINPKLAPYKLFLHPIRLAIMNIMAKSFSLIRSKLKRMLRQSTDNNLLAHIEILVQAKFLAYESKNPEEMPNPVIYITQPGINLFEEFKELIANI